MKLRENARKQGYKSSFRKRDINNQKKKSVEFKIEGKKTKFTEE